MWVLKTAQRRQCLCSREMVLQRLTTWVAEVSDRKREACSMQASAQEIVQNTHLCRQMLIDAVG